MKYLDSAAQVRVDDPYTLYLRIAIEQTELLDYESYHIHGERFIQTADSIRKVLEKLLPGLKDGDSARCLFYIANIYGGIGVIKAKTGSWLPAIKGSLTSVGLLKEVLKRDSSIIAAKLGIGAFHYYLSKSFAWLPFVDSDSPKRGVQDIETATTSRSPFSLAAKNTLCWVLIDKEEFCRADSVALSVLEETPRSSIFLRIRCLIAFWGGKLDLALELGQKLAEISLMRDPVNWSDYVMAHYVMAGAYEAQGKIKEALAVIRQVLDAQIPSGSREIPPLRKNLKRIIEVRKKCLE